MSANAIKGLGKSGRYADLKRRLLFLLGALVVFRIGAHIPVPGIDPNVLADLFKSQPAGFRLVEISNEYAKGRRPMSYVYLGRARRA